MISERKNKLSGAIVGIGFIRNGVMEYKKLDTPIHNRITQDGLDYLLTLNGTDMYADLGSSRTDYPAIGTCWIGDRNISTGSYSSKVYGTGVLAYAAYGSGTGETSFTDTELVNRISDYTNTYITNNPELLGVKTYTDTYGKYSYRVTYKFGEAITTTTVNEVGFYGKYYNHITDTESYVMFSRVALPQPIVLEAGVELIVTYQLDVTNAYATEGSIDFTGLTDSEGNPLKAVAKLYRVVSSGLGTWSDGPNNEFGISENGTASHQYENSFPKVYPPFVVRTQAKNEWNWNYGSVACYSSNQSIALPANNASLSTDSLCESLSYATSNTSQGAFFALFTPYLCKGKTSKYRDVKYVFGEDCPYTFENSYTDISLIGINGMLYRFGYYDNGTFVPQVYRKYGNKALVLTSRVRYATQDTTDDVYTPTQDIQHLYVLAKSNYTPSSYYFDKVYKPNATPVSFNDGSYSFWFTPDSPVAAAANETTITASTDPSCMYDVKTGCTVTKTSDGLYTVSYNGSDSYTFTGLFKLL